MPFDIKNLNPPARFHYNEDEWVELRTMPLDEVRKIRKKVFKKNIEYYKADGIERPFRYETEEIDDDKLNELLWDYQIVNWNIKEPDGKEIECNKANKLLLMGNSPEFSEFIVKSLNQLAQDEEDRREKSEKN